MRTNIALTLSAELLRDRVLRNCFGFVSNDFTLYSCFETLPDIKIARDCPGDDVITHERRTMRSPKG